VAYSEAQDVRLILRGWNDPHMSDDPDYTPAMLDDAQIEYAIADADSQIDAVLRRLYALPLPDPIPDLIHGLSTNMAAVLADSIWRGAREYANELAPARLLWGRCTRILDRIGSGSLQLYNVGEGPEPVGNEAVVINPYPGDILLDTDVYPRGNSPDRTGQKAEFAAVPIPQTPYGWN
jgi:Protein of unknown function (DUF1320)